MSEPVEDRGATPMPGLSKLSATLAIVFALSMVLGTGPGVLLVNRPESIAGVPLVYAWGILWYVVQVAVVLIAYFTVWNASADKSAPESSSHSTDTANTGGAA